MTEISSRPGTLEASGASSAANQLPIPDSRMMPISIEMKTMNGMTFLSTMSTESRPAW
jgi:hypothetical protein